MSFSVKGYLLEPPRVGQANSPFTITPDNYISDPTTFATAYPSTEANPRTEYLTLVLSDGDLADATFGWTKNEIVQRFDYDGQDQQFKPLRGAPIITVGVLTASSNTTRLRVAKPIAVLAAAPFRLSVGATGSGTTLTVNLVADNASFGSPLPGTVELSQTTGDLNWNATDLSTYYLGQTVRYQRQAFYAFKESNGKVGTIDSTVLLNPLPGLGIGLAHQVPLLRIGFSPWLKATYVADDVALGLYSPASGEVAWSGTTGMLKFSAADIAANPGKSIYYDGVLFAKGIKVPQQSIGTVTAYPSGPMTVPAPGGDIIFRSVAGIATGTAVFPDTLTLNDGAANFLASGVTSGDYIVMTSGPMTGASYRVGGVISATSLSVDTLTPLTNLTSATYQVQKRFQFPETLRLSSITPTDPGKAGEVQVDDAGNVKFSSSDQATYAGTAVTAIVCDLSLERGTSLRFFRTPVDPSAVDPTLKDVTCIYAVAGATLADPIIGSPQVFLPVVPLDDGKIVVSVAQGTGSFTSDTFPRLDTQTPPVGTDPIYGYMLDFDQRTFQFGVRKNQQLFPIPKPTGALALPDPLIRSENLVLELETAPLSGTYAAVTIGTDALFDSTSGVVSFTSTKGVTIASGSSASVLGTSLTDTGASFSSVSAGDFLVIPAGTAKGVYGIVSKTSTVLTLNESIPTATGVAYTILRQKEVLADRYFSPIDLVDPNTKVERVRPLGTSSNGPRLNIPTAYIGNTRLQLDSVFVTPVTVANDGAFSSPGAVPVGSIEVSLSTGNMNFSSTDLGKPVSWVLKLIERKDYKVQARTGFIALTDRLLSYDELLVTYIPSSGTVPIVEHATFLVRKEITQDHPTPTSVLSFNPLGRAVASVPPPAVYRGGRPQKIGTQVVVDTSSSTITFQADGQLTNALPHGATVQPGERVYIDYFVYAAIGGENSTSVLQAPMTFAQVQITSGQSSFKIAGNRVSDFPANHILRVEREDVYLLGTPTFDPVTALTTVTLAGAQTFRNDAQDPNLFVTSGLTRATGALFTPSYFSAESNAYDTTARGSNKIRIQGDRTLVYTTGVVVMMTGGSPSVMDFYLVTGSNYKSDLDRTEVTLMSTTSRQYTSGTHTLSRSLRPILEGGTSSVRTVTTPILTKPTTVFRQTEGTPGTILTNVVDYAIDDSGRITLTTPLQPNEEISAFYTGYTIVPGGLRLRASYTAVITPSSDNGISGQTLLMSYNTFLPDSFFYRVETATNFLGEVAKQYKSNAQSASPTGGPRVSNTASPRLFEQGRESIFFQEKHLLNEDYIASQSLKFYNDAINYLEDVLADMDGRVVGDSDGRFLFNASLTNPSVPTLPLPSFPPGPIAQPPTTLTGVLNQIDDQILVSAFPVDFSQSPLFPLKFIGTYQKAYLPGPLSRFYPTRRTKYGVTVAGTDTSATMGDQVMDTGIVNMTGGPVEYLARRRPRARVLRKALVGDTVLYVSNPNAQDTLLRPAFQVGMAVDILAQTGASLFVNALPPTTPTIKVASILSAPDRIVLSTPLTADIPVGATITTPTLEAAYGAPYTPFGKTYQFGTEYLTDPATGKILYPFDYSLFPLTPTPTPPNSQERLDITATSTNAATAPEKFPALFGGVTTDDGEEHIPLLNPTVNCEQTQLGIEQLYESTVLSTYVDAPFVGSGNLDAAKTTITNVGGAFPSPAPEPYDLVRILTGLNGATEFRRIVSVTASTLTVDVPFSQQDTGFSYLVTVSNSVASGTTATLASSFNLTDGSANFLAAGVIPGHTAVVLSGGSLGARRQIIQVTATTITVAHAWPVSGGGATTYRIDKSLSTFSDTQPLIDALAASKAILSTNTAPVPPATEPFNNEKLAVESVLDLAFTDRLSPASQSGTVSGSVLTGTTNFLTSGVIKGDFVFIRSGTNRGIYPIVNPPAPSSTTVTIAGTFPSPGAVTYRIVKTFGITQTKSLQDLFSVLIGGGGHLGVDDILASGDAFRTLLQTAVTVLVPPSNPDANIYATAIQPSDVSARLTQVNARLATLSDTAGPIKTIETLLKTGERLYDKRYTWINARINLQNGTLVKQQRAVTDRASTLAQILDQLTKLLTVQG